MPSIYKKPVRQLMKDMIPALGIEKNQFFSRADVLLWFKENYPKIKKGTIFAHLLRFSVNAPSRVHYSSKPIEDDVFFQVGSSRFRLYSPEKDGTPIYKSENISLVEEEEKEIEQPLQSEFAYEKDLQNFLAKNLDVIESGLRLYEDEGIKGIEFPAGGRFIDILAIDKNDNYVVIELKVARGYDRVIGQLLRYTSWIKKNHAENNQKVRGMVIARDISEDLLLACSDLGNIQLFEYQLSVKVKKVEFF